MSKFISLLSTFKNGLVSPRLRGAVVSTEDKTTVEQLENFIIDRTGAATKRSGLQLESTQEFIEYNEMFQHYTFNLLNDEYTFRFDPFVAFNATDNNSASSVKNSRFLTVFKGANEDINKQTVKVFGKGRRLQNAISAWSYVGSTVTITIGTHTLTEGDVIRVAGLVSSTNAANTSKALLTAVTATTVTYTFTAIPTGTATVNASTAFIFFLDDLCLWNESPSTNGTSTETGVSANLSYDDTTIIHAKKISDRTVVFTTEYFSFLVSILDHTNSTKTDTIRRFYLYPYHVSTNLLLLTLGKSWGDAAPCPICPTNFPFNNVNVDTTLSVAIFPYVLSGTGIGSAPTAGVVTKSDNYFSYTITVPTAMQVLNGEIEYLDGRFISIPSADATKDVIFYISGYLSSTANRLKTITSWSYIGTAITLTVGASHGFLTNDVIAVSGLVSTTNPANGYFVVTSVTSTQILFTAVNIPTGTATVSSAQVSSGGITYNAIMVVGSNPATSLPLASAWSISSWGILNAPRVVGEAFGRLMYANTRLEPSKWWAAANHPDNTQYRQGFKVTSLLQDAEANFSGLNYAGVDLATIDNPVTGVRSTIRDIFRFSFYDSAPSGGAIGWISSRRNIHMGTSKGECQITPPGGNYNAASYYQIRVGTTSADLKSITEGDRKIFYLADGGKDIRYISTEDKDYDSLDELLSVLLQGLELVFTKIEWVEKIHALLCFTSSSRIFILTIHSDTKIKAFSELVSSKTLLDFSGLRIYLKDNSNYLNTYMNYNVSMYGDLYVTAVGVYPDFTQFFNTTIYIVIVTSAGIISRYPFIVGPSSPSDPDLTAQGVPTSASLTTETTYIYRDLMTCKLKTPPIHEGEKFGSSVGDVQRIDRISVLVDHSGAFKYGTTPDILIDAEGVTGGALINKIVSLDFPQSPDREQAVYIESSDATALNISGISLRGVSYSGE